MEKSYKILIDTNFFFLPFYENYDVLQEIPNFLERNQMLAEGYYTLKKNIWEIENKLKTAKSQKWKNIYKLVLEYIRKNNVKIIDTPVNKNTDHLIVETVIKDPYNWVVCTQDKNLRDILRKLKIKVIYYAEKELHML